MREPGTEGSSGEPPRNWRSPRVRPWGWSLSAPRDAVASSGQPRLAGTGNYISQKAENSGSPGKRPGRHSFPVRRRSFGGESAAARPRRRPPRGGPAERTWRPGAEPMSSSVAGPDCCGGLGNADLRQVRAGRGAAEAGRGLARPGGSSRPGPPPPTPGGRGPVARQRGRGVAGRGCVFGGGARACACKRRIACARERVPECVCACVCAPGMVWSELPRECVF